MCRLCRWELFTPDEKAIVHVMNRTVRRCFLFGDDELTGRNYDYRKDWIELRMVYLARYFGIDILCYSILSNHFHQVLRQRPDVVAQWSDTEVAQRWLMLCPKRKNKDGSAKEPTEGQLNAIRNNPKNLAETRSRLSDISWWMRLLCQNIAQRINRDDDEKGKVWQNRYKAVRLLDETSLLACAAYVDLNPIRAAIAEVLEQSDYTSIQRRIQALKEGMEAELLGGGEACSNLSHAIASTLVGDTKDDQVESTLNPGTLQQAQEVQSSRLSKARDRSIAPVKLDELRDALQVRPSTSGYRCSDLGFLNMSDGDYIELLDWTTRVVVPGKRGSTPPDAPPIFERLNLGISAESWCELITSFGKLFSTVAGKPHIVERYRSSKRKQKFTLKPEARQLLTV